MFFEMCSLMKYKIYLWKKSAQFRTSSQRPGGTYKLILYGQHKFDARTR